MNFHGRGTIAAICMFSAWLGLCHGKAPGYQAQQPEAEIEIEEGYGHGGDPPPPGAVVHIEESDFWHPEPVLRTHFSPDSRSLLSFAGEQLYRWEVPSGRLVARTSFQGIGPAHQLTFSPDYQRLASEDREKGHCRLWELQTGRLLQTIDGLDGPAELGAFSPDAKLLLVRQPGRGAIQIRNASTGELLHTIEGFDGPLEVATFSPDSTSLLTKQRGHGKVQLWDTASGRKEREWNTGLLQIRIARIEHATLLVVAGDCVIRRWDITSGNLVQEQPFERNVTIHETRLSPDGQLMAIVAPRNEIGGVFDIQTGKERFELRNRYAGHTWMHVAGFFPDGQTLLTLSNDTLIELWDVQTGMARASFFVEADHAFVSPDGRWLATRPDLYDSGRELQLWDPETGRQISTPRMRTYFRPVFSKLAASDPMQVAIHWADGWGRIPSVGRYIGSYDPAATIETMDIRILTPAGDEYHLHPKVAARNDPRPHRRDAFPATPSVFLELSGDGFRTLVLGDSGTWEETDTPSFGEIGEYRLSISGNIIIDSQEPIPFQTAEATIKRAAEGVLTIEEIRRRAIAKLEEMVRLQGKETIIPDDGDYGDYKPLHVIGLPTHERVVLLAIEHPSQISGGRLADLYRVVVRPDGAVIDITHKREQTCLAAGTLVDTEQGPRPIEQLQPGNRVWSFDLENQRPLLTTVQTVYHGEAPAVLQITPTLSATAEHPVFADGEWIPAGNLRQGDIVVGREEPYLLPAMPQLLNRKTQVFDLAVNEPHNFFAGGILVHNKSMAFGMGFFDRWKLFHVAPSPYANQVTSRSYWPRIVGLALALIAAGVSIYALRRRGAIAPPPTRVPAGELP